MEQRYLPSDILDMIENYQKYNKINDEVLKFFLIEFTFNITRDEWFNEMNDLLKSLGIKSKLIIDNEGFYDFVMDHNQILTNKMIAPVIQFIVDKFGDFKFNEDLEKFGSNLRLIWDNKNRFYVAEVNRLT